MRKKYKRISFCESDTKKPSLRKRWGIKLNPPLICLTLSGLRIRFFIMADFPSDFIFSLCPIYNLFFSFSLIPIALTRKLICNFSTWSTKITLSYVIWPHFIDITCRYRRLLTAWGYFTIIRWGCGRGIIHVFLFFDSPFRRRFSASRWVFLPLSVSRYRFWAFRWARRLPKKRHSSQQYAWPLQQLRQTQKTVSHQWHWILTKSKINMPPTIANSRKM